MSLVLPDILHDVKGDGILHVERRKVEHVFDALLWYVFEKSFSHAAVRVDNTKATAVLDVLDGHVLKQS